MSSFPPEGIAVRAARPGDAAAAAELVRALEAELGYRAAATAGEFRDWWSFAELETDSWVLEQAGRLLGLAWLARHGGDADVSAAVAPEERGRGLGSALAGLCESRARELRLPRVLSHAYAADADGRALLERRGYREARRFHEMTVELAAPPPEASWPDGIRPEPFRPGDAWSFHAALGESFADEWGFVPMPFEEWRRRRVEEADTSLYFLARDGGEIAAVIRCEPERRGIGWVGSLGVRPAWRRRGLGRALLLHALGEFHRRGISEVGLGVDSANPTGANRLYESVGMRVTLEDVVYEKELS